MNDISDWWDPAAEADEIELVVDLSNVCCDTGIGNSNLATQLARIDLIAEGWGVWDASFERPAVRLVADEVLRSAFTPEDRRRLKDLESEAWVEVVPKADPTILDHAERSSAMVVSNDQFVGHRHEYPWIDDSPGQFVGWTSHAGMPLLCASRIRPHTSYSVSRAAEADEIKALRLNSTGGQATLEGVYRCDNHECLRRKFSPPGAETPPNRRGSADRPTCPGCGQPLTLVGRRTDTAVIKLSGHAGFERVPLPDGSSVVIGRASPDLDIQSLVPGQLLPRISRTHLRVSFSGGVVYVEDLNSSAGSAMQNWDKGSRQHAAAVTLHPGRKTPLRPRDRVVVADALTIERSGRRYPFDLSPVGANGD